MGALFNAPLAVTTYIKGLNDNGYTEVLANAQAGGFNDLLDGVTLTGKGLIVRLARGANQPTGNESTRHGATLNVKRADGAERTCDGTWTCAPCRSAAGRGEGGLSPKGLQ